ncbi:MAG: penicillin-binding transpeptidase domain-containing protein [Bacteroidota bacterium]
MKKLLLFSLFFLTFNSFGQKIDTVNLKTYFGEYIGGFSVYNLKTDSYIQYNIEHCKKRFSPCSTFKIPNSLIGLETGIIPDTGYIIKYDSVSHPRDLEMLKREPFKYWFQDLSLKRAFKYSCVWYYQELARRVGQERMKKYINLIDYGNNDISSGIDNFWLCGSIEISINEQIDFLKKLYLQKLDGFSDKTIDAVKSIMLYETTSDYKLYGKTGGGNCWNNKMIGWYVGFVETDSGTSIFAMNIIVNNIDDLNNNFRIELTKKTLRDLKIIK